MSAVIVCYVYGNQMYSLVHIYRYFIVTMHFSIPSDMSNLECRCYNNVTRVYKNTLISNNIILNTCHSATIIKRNKSIYIPRLEQILDN